MTAGVVSAFHDNDPPAAQMTSAVMAIRMTTRAATRLMREA